MGASGHLTDLGRVCVEDGRHQTTFHCLAMYVGKALVLRYRGGGSIFINDQLWSWGSWWLLVNVKLEMS